MIGGISIQTGVSPKFDNRRLLKKATSQIHQLTEDKWFSAGKFNHLELYLNWLKVMHSVHSQLGGPAAISIGDAVLVTLENQRITNLNNDLGIKFHQNVNVTFTPSFSWGVLYSISGSALGASVLIKEVTQHANWPTNYINDINRFAKSGGVKHFFENLNRTKLNIKEARKGAAAVFLEFANQKGLN